MFKLLPIVFLLFSYIAVAQEQSQNQNLNDTSEIINSELSTQPKANIINSPNSTIIKSEVKEVLIEPNTPGIHKNANPNLMTPPASSERGGFQVGEYGLFQKDIEKFKFTYSGENFMVAKEYNDDGLNAVVTEHITGFEFAYSDSITTYIAQSYHTSFSDEVESELGDLRMGMKRNFGLVYSDIEFEWNSRLYLPFKRDHRQVGKIQWRNYFTFIKPIMQSSWNILYELETRFWFYTEDELGQDSSSFTNKIGINYKGFSFIDPLLYGFISNKFRHTGSKFNEGSNELDWEDPLDFDDSIGLGFEAYIPITSFLGIIPVIEYEFSYSSNQGKTFEPFNPGDTIYLLIFNLKL